ncbi:MAG: T9SS type A sorting domain-containing protein [Prevotella sp.]|nr:T9SS type A sorting domain-containing protein [Prevotella sp.]
MKRLTITTLLLTVGLAIQAQKIDFNFFGRSEAEGNAPGFTAWNSTTSGFPGFPKQLVSDTLTVNGITFIVQNGPYSQGKTLGCGWNKTIVQTKDKLVGDGIETLDLDDSGNTPKLQGPAGELEVIIEGLSAGAHTLLAYHNNPTNYQGPKLDVYVDGMKKQKGVEQTMNKEKASESATSYVHFTVTEGQPVHIWYRATPDAATDYTSTAPHYCSSVFINALVLDQGNPATMAHDPYPANYDSHAVCDGGSVQLRWSPASKAVKHHLFFGESKEAMEDKGIVTDTVFTVDGLYSMNTYFWTVKEVDADGNEYESETWNFQPRHLAFPGAEGYGRFAKGGRGGSVYHVTNLTNDETPGSLIYGLKHVEGPRTIVFDVAGLIDMDFQAVFADPNITLAAQTAPGKGICLKHSNVNFGNDNIIRFLRARRGLGTPDQTGNAMGVTGAYNCIIDHATASWGTDETFSSRGAHNITFQKSMIAEALGIAHHKNYPDGTNHGYAATIGGDIGSFHHNLLADCNGRNWSMGGGLTGDGYYAGRLDIFNNVCYNWHGRTTDGGAHEVNFVGNYYKEGPAVNLHYLFTLNLEGTGQGTQSAYVYNNVRDNLNGTLDRDADNMKRIQVSGGQVVDWTYWGTEPYFPSEAVIDDPVLAYKKVLSDVGANQPVFDSHDQRMIRETRDRTWTYVGSLSGIKGEIDSEADCGGFEIYPEEQVAEDFDVDQDGIPTWFEKINGTDPNVANNNADNDRDGYTDLEDYLNWMAEEHRILAPGETAEVSLKALFAGFTASPAYTYSYEGNQLQLTMKEDTTLMIKVTGELKTLNTVTLKVTDADGASMTRALNVAVNGNATAIRSVDAETVELRSYELFTLNGAKLKGGKCEGNVHQIRLNDVPTGIYLLKATDTNGKVRSYKVVR